MPEIPKDLAEKIYSQYEITVTDPMAFDELFQIEKRKGLPDAIMISDPVRHAYDRGIVKPEGQLFWIFERHKKEANLKKSYDIGFFNALATCMFIFTGKEPEFEKKPPVKNAKKKTKK